MCPTLCGHYNDYRASFTSIREVAQMYREAGFNKFKTTGLSNEWPRDKLNVVVEFEARADKGSPEFSGRPAFVETNNKIKHRFLVFEDMSELGQAAIEEDYWIHYTHFPKKQQSVQIFYHNILNIARISAEVSALILKLDSEQLLEPE